MYVLPCDIHTKLQLFYFTAKYFMLKFFQSSRPGLLLGQGARGKGQEDSFAPVSLPLITPQFISSFFILFFMPLASPSLTGGPG